MLFFWLLKWHLAHDLNARVAHDILKCKSRRSIQRFPEEIPRAIQKKYLVLEKK